MDFYLGICMDLDPIITQMTLHSELQYGRTIVLANLFLLGIVSNTYTYTHTHTRTYVEHKVKSLQRHSTYLGQYDFHTHCTKY